MIPRDMPGQPDPDNKSSYKERGERLDYGKGLHGLSVIVQALKSNPAMGVSDMNLYGLVLAGGFSTRMGQDKALLVYHDRTEVERLVSLLASFCERTLVSIRSDQAKTGAYDAFECVEDRHDDIGPMSGLLSAMDRFPDAAWLVVACDMPFLEYEDLNALVQARDPSALATGYRNPEDNYPEPLIAIYEPGMSGVLEQARAVGRFSLRDVLRSMPGHWIDPLHPRSISSVDTPEEYQRIRSRMTG